MVKFLRTLNVRGINIKIFQSFCVEGISFEFIGLNLTGFLFLSIYSSFEYFDESLGIKVDVQDLAFAYNAVFATLITIGQTFFYTHGKNKLKMWCIYLIIALWTFTIIYFIITVGTKSYEPSNRLDIYSMMGYEKIFISFIKYLPQVYLNYKRRSTSGWSIMNILCDFAGGFLAFLQIVLQSIDEHVDVFSGGLNIVKFLLSIIAMGFDIIFMTQHYILYPVKKNRLMDSEDQDTVSLSKNQSAPLTITPIE